MNSPATSVARLRTHRVAMPVAAGSGQWQPEQTHPGASWATQSKPTEPQDALQVCKPHLDLLALAPRLLEALGASERPGNVSRVFMDVARDLARWILWTALRFEWATIA